MPVGSLQLLPMSVETVCQLLPPACMREDIHSQRSLAIFFHTDRFYCQYSEAIGVERDARLDAYIELEDEGRGLPLADHSRLCSAGDHQRQGTPRTTIITRVFVADSSYNFWCEGKSGYAAVSRPCSALCESVQESSAASDGGDTDAGVTAFTVLKHSNGGERATQ